MSDFMLVWVRIALEKGLRCYEKSRGADAALESGMLEEFLLQGMQPLGSGHALNRCDLLTFNLQCEDEAGVNENVVNNDGTSAAISVVATLFGSSKAQFLSKDFKQTLAGFTEKIQLLSIYRRFNMYPLCHLPLVLSSTPASQSGSVTRNC